MSHRPRTRGTTLVRVTGRNDAYSCRAVAWQAGCAAATALAIDPLRSD